MKRIFIILFIIGVMSSITLQAKAFSSEEVQEWRKIGVSKGWISNWTSNGITLKEAKIWYDVGVKNVQSIKKWKYENIKPDEAKELIILGITIKDMHKWKRAGINNINEIKKWKNLNLNYYNVSKYIQNGITPEILKSWNNEGIGGSAINEFKKYGINTPEEAKQWKNAGIGHTNDLKYLKKAKITTPAELKQWKDVGIRIYDIFKWKQLGINDPKEAIAWKKVENISYIREWQKAGVMNPKEVKKWKNENISVYDIAEIKKRNLNIDTIKKWRGIGIKNIKNIVLLKDGGFTKPNQYKPYKGMYLEHAIKLKQWNIKPNVLVKSMSYSNNVFNQNLYFSNENTFKKAYALIENQCDKIEKDKWFAKVDMTANNDKCYIFVGKMIQRLDEKSLFGNVTQKGLISGTGNRYFFAEKFQGDWMEGKTNLGVIKGSGSFSYKSTDGSKHVIPQGEVIFMK